MNWRSYWPFVLVAFLYLATSPYHRGLNNPNEMVRVYMTKAVVDDKTFAIDRVIRQWGGVDDKAVRGGAIYASKAPLQSLIGVPVYAFAAPIFRTLGLRFDKLRITFVLRIFGSAVFGIAFAWLFLAWAAARAGELGASRASGLGVGLGVTLGTMLYPYALTFTGHLLAAAASGCCFLGVVWLARCRPRSRRWIMVAVFLGFSGAAAPFAEYPAALSVAPILVAAFFVTPTWRDRVDLAAWMLVGGLIPLAFGLHAHAAMWGSPWRTGYSFLENASYVTVHKEGFFGVRSPKFEAFVGALFSPATGLFFFSPVLLVGLAALLRRTFSVASSGANPTTDTQLLEPSALRGPLPRALAVATFAGVVLEVLFISGHTGWRGGWTLGPRYIIPLAPLLGFWVIETLVVPKLRGATLALAAMSIVATGFAAAIYPHLSDVFTNPLKTFVWPSYIKGFGSYGLGHALGLTGWPANLVHIVPLIIAIAYTAMAAAERSRPARLRQALVLCAVVASAALVVALVPERDPLAADRENARLWGFWEPARGEQPWRAREHWSALAVSVDDFGHGGRRACSWRVARDACAYGDAPWQTFRPGTLVFDGRPTDVLLLHPIAGQTVVVEVPVQPDMRALEVIAGLSDAAIESDNDSPVVLRAYQGKKLLFAREFGRSLGFDTLRRTLTSTTPVRMEVSVRGRDGARHFGFDVIQRPL
ncbi:MAG: hypothetical protein IPK13_20355 [Deltaproteobacteria bacterium]|nr:hypothetical protein [Deltaproteobacteria bacterium]